MIMFYVLFGEWGDCVAEFNTEAEAIVYIERQTCPDDYWLGYEDGEAGFLDTECGFDPYMGDFTYDCQVKFSQKIFKKVLTN